MPSPRPTQSALIPAPTQPKKPKTWLQHICGTGRHAPRPTRCQTCRAQILAAHTDEPGSIAIRLDPTPLTPLGEAIARLGKTPTFTITIRRDRASIQYRSKWEIITTPIGKPHKWRGPYDVFPAHQCGQHLPTQESSLQPPKPRKVDDNDEPPF